MKPVRVEEFNQQPHHLPSSALVSSQHTPLSLQPLEDLVLVVEVGLQSRLQLKDLELQLLLLDLPPLLLRRVKDAGGHRGGAVSLRREVLHRPSQISLILQVAVVSPVHQFVVALLQLISLLLYFTQLLRQLHRETELQSDLHPLNTHS